MTFMRRRLLLCLPGYTVAVLALSSCPPVGTGGARGTTSIEVRLRDHRFVPDQVRARPGDRIRFHNQDEDLHSIVLVGREDILEETFVDPGTTHELLLPADVERGRYLLACTIHVDMRAELVVG